MEELLYLLTGSATGIGTSARAVGSGTIGALAIPTGTSAPRCCGQRYTKVSTQAWRLAILMPFFFVSSFFAIFAYNLKMTSDRIAGNGDVKGVRFFLPLKRQVALIYFLYGSCGIVAIASVRYSLPSALLAGGECLPSLFLFWGENNNVAIVITVW